MPDVGFAALAVIGAIVVAGGGGWMLGVIKSKRNKKTDE